MGVGLRRPSPCHLLTLPPLPFPFLPSHFSTVFQRFGMLTDEWICNPRPPGAFSAMDSIMYSPFVSSYFEDFSGPRKGIIPWLGNSFPPFFHVTPILVPFPLNSKMRDSRGLPRFPLLLFTVSTPVISSFLPLKRH